MIASQRRPKVLVVAYACEPGRGSEPGAGWGVVRSLANVAECTVLVAPEHMPGIRRWQASHQDARVSFIEVPERWMTAPARRGRWTRFFLYLAWLRRAYRIGTTLHAQQPFDVAWHVTYSTYWLPSPVGRFAVPSVWGPVGGAVTTPRSLWGLLGVAGMLEEALDFLAVRLCSYLPATRRTWRDARVRIVQNAETRNQLPHSMRTTARTMNHAVFVEPLPSMERRGGSTCVIIGRLERRKGGSLAIQALAHAADDLSLTFLGDGPDRRRLERLVRRLGLEARVHFRGDVPRAQLPGYYATAAAGLFVGLREEGGLALAEAMMAGLPVIVLANGGARTIASQAVDLTRVAFIDARGVDEAARQIGAAMTTFSRLPPNRQPILDTGAGDVFIRDVLATVLPSRSPHLT